MPEPVHDDLHGREVLCHKGPHPENRVAEELYRAENEEIGKPETGDGDPEVGPEGSQIVQETVLPLAEKTPRGMAREKMMRVATRLRRSVFQILSPIFSITGLPSLKE